MGVGVLNAGVFYMGLLADPEQSWEQGFKVAVLLIFSCSREGMRGRRRDGKEGGRDGVGEGKRTVAW